MARIADLNTDDLTAEQREAFEEIAASRGGAARGPFSVWLRTPRIALAASRFGAALRLEGQLDRRLFELATLVLAAHWHAPYPWVVHEAAALEHGVDAGIVEAIRTGQTPVFDRDDEQLIYDIGVEMLTTGTLAEDAYARALEALGLDVLIEVVTTFGFYGVAALVANVFDADVPGDRQPFTPEVDSVSGLGTRASAPPGT